VLRRRIEGGKDKGGEGINKANSNPFKEFDVSVY
jgi:hypothetical protein